jgi:hypothetical protein
VWRRDAGPAHCRARVRASFSSSFHHLLSTHHFRMSNTCIPYSQIEKEPIISLLGLQTCVDSDSLEAAANAAFAAWQVAHEGWRTRKNAYEKSQVQSAGQVRCLTSSPHPTT